MKKILAIFLALITILSIALVACNNNTTTTSGGGDDADDDDNDDFVVQTKDTTDDSDSDTDNDNEGGWEAAAYTIYCMTNGLNIRSEDSTAGDKLGSVNIGEALTATERNDDWYKISYNGGVAYVSREYVTASKDEATFTNDAEKTDLKIKDSGDNENPYQVNLRDDPVVAEDTLSGIVITDAETANGELKKVGQNADGSWYKVEYTKDGNTGTYYIKMTSAIRGYFGLSSSGSAEGRG